MMPLRVLLGALGVAVGLYGAWLLLDRQETAQVVEVAVWFLVGVLVHDAVVAPLALLAGAALPRLLPVAARGPAVVGLVVVTTVTVVAIPVLGRFGALPDNLTLLDRPYVAGWAVLVGLIAAAAAAVAVRNVRQARSAAGGPQA